MVFIQYIQKRNLNMPLPLWHKQKQNHNLLLTLHINKTLKNYEDWKITTLFYTILHCVDEYLSEHPLNIHPQIHNDRKDEINNHLRNIRKDYRKLKIISEHARYDKNISNKEYIQFLKIYGKLKKYFTPITCKKCGLLNRLNTGSCTICKTTL